MTWNEHKTERALWALRIPIDSRQVQVLETVRAEHPRAIAEIERAQLKVDEIFKAADTHEVQEMNRRIRSN